MCKKEYGFLLSILVFFSYALMILLLVFSFVNCGGDIEYPEPEPTGEIGSDVPTGSYCGDWVCDKDETYWNCLDCVDPITGGPKNGYCGDGICFNENMLDCWTDCRPEPFNPNAEDDFPAPRPEPIPIPDPRPTPDPGPIRRLDVL